MLSKIKNKLIENKIDRSIYLPALNSLIRPLWFAFLVNILGEYDDLKFSLVIVGYFGFLSILDSINITLARAKYIYNFKGAFVLSALINSIFVLVFSLLLIKFVGLNDFGDIHVFLFIVLFFYSALLFYERVISKKEVIVLVAIIDLMVIALSAILLFFDFFYLSLIGFFSLQISRLVGILIYIPKIGFIDFTTIINNDLKIGAYFIFNVLTQVVSVMSASLPFLFYMFNDDYSKYLISLVAVRWLLSISSIFSMFINIYSSRLFYGGAGFNMNVIVNNFINQYFLLFNTFLFIPIVFFLLGLFFFNTVSITQSMILFVPAISFLNFNSSVFHAIGRSDMALFSQLIIIFLTLAFVSNIFAYTTLSILIDLIGIFLLIIYVNKKRNKSTRCLK